MGFVSELVEYAVVRVQTNKIAKKSATFVKSTLFLAGFYNVTER